MSGTKTRENVLLIILILLLAGVSYYHFFYAPLQSELSSVAAQTAEVQEETQTEAAKAVKMASMQKELAAAGQTTEVADYDNAKAVMTQLSGILASASDYSVSFGEPAQAPDGTYRRTLAISFSAPSYKTAKTIVQSIAQSRWRTLISSVSFISGGNTSPEAPQTGILSGPVSVNLSVTYFERAPSAG